MCSKKYNFWANALKKNVEKFKQKQLIMVRANGILWRVKTRIFNYKYQLVQLLSYSISSTSTLKKSTNILEEAQSFFSCRLFGSYPLPHLSADTVTIATSTFLYLSLSTPCVASTGTCSPILSSRREGLDPSTSYDSKKAWYSSLL